METTLVCFLVMPFGTKPPRVKARRRPAQCAQKQCFPTIHKAGPAIQGIKHLRLL